jgi:hypothetical protein
LLTMPDCQSFFLLLKWKCEFLILAKGGRK